MTWHPHRPLYACETCGSLGIQYEAWVDANRDRIRDDSGSSGYWCDRCQDHGKRAHVLANVGPGLWVDGSWDAAASQMPRTIRDLLRRLCPGRERVVR